MYYTGLMMHFRDYSSSYDGSIGLHPNVMLDQSVNISNSLKPDLYLTNITNVYYSNVYYSNILLYS